MRRRGWKSRGEKKGSKKKIFFLVLVIFTFLSIQSLVFVEKSLREPLMNVAKIRVKQIATEAINKAISEQVMHESNYEKLIDWKTDKNGKVTGFMLNYSEHRRITSETVKIVQDTLDELQKIPDYIPLGQALNSAILASYGPDVKVKFVPEGAVKIDLNTRQKDAGINMLLVEVYIRIITEVAIIIPFDTAPEVVETEVPISYLLVVGDVPMYYFDNKGQQVESSKGIGPLPPTISLPNIPPADTIEE
jgi:sporulation protein YunB